MLVLSRQRHETIIIGDDIEITVVDVRGEKVRIGITAPPHISVHRKEVYESIKRESQASGNSDGHVESLAKRKQRKPEGSEPSEQPGDDQRQDPPPNSHEGR